MSARIERILLCGFLAGCNLVIGADAATLEGGSNAGGQDAGGDGGGVECDEPAQTPGDCKLARCVDGGVVQDPDTTDVPPDDGNECTTQSCSASGTVETMYMPPGAKCNEVGACDDMGNCSSCVTPSDCGTDTACGTRTCADNSCGWSYAAPGPADDQLPGDCVRIECDGSTEIPIEVSDAADVTPDAEECTNDLCQNGEAVHPNSTAGTACSVGVCNGTGECVQCAGSTDCFASGYGVLCKGDGTCGCTANFHCGGGAGRICKQTGVCGCSDSNDCGDGGTWGPECINGTCGCTTDADCGGDSDYCFLATNRCVECLDDGDCGPGQRVCENNECVDP